MSDNVKTIVFAVVLCLGCSLLLTSASAGLKKYQQQNIRIDRQKNILKSVGLIESDRKYRGREIDSLFADRIRCLQVGPDGEVAKSQAAGAQTLPVYLHIDKDGSVADYIVPINTQGLWGKILGYLAIRNDGATISGFTVYQHAETPGLGGEIEKNWFQKNFMGKKIVNSAGDFVAVSIAKGRTADGIASDRQINYVDGISGATLTGKYLTKGLHDVLSEYESVSIHFRKEHFLKLPQGQGDCKS
jgi:Na+-transporting NADH:ubiquinone oxidoreductase subunit C